MLFVIRHRFSGPALVFEEEWMIKLSTGGGRHSGREEKTGKEKDYMKIQCLMGVKVCPRGSRACVCVRCVRCVVLSAVCGLQVSRSLSVSLSLSHSHTRLYSLRLC